MRKKNILIRIKEALIEVVRLYKILIARKKAEVFPGWSRTISRIREVAKEEGVDSDLAVRVAECESKFDSLALRVNVGGSVDRGLYQWNDYWHPEVSNECAFNIECSTRQFCRAVKHGKINWWYASKSCWNSKI